LELKDDKSSSDSGSSESSSSSIDDQYISGNQKMSKKMMKKRDKLQFVLESIVVKNHTERQLVLGVVNQDVIKDYYGKITQNKDGSENRGKKNSSMLTSKTMPAKSPKINSVLFERFEIEPPEK